MILALIGKIAGTLAWSYANESDRDDFEQELLLTLLKVQRIYKGKPLKEVCKIGKAAARNRARDLYRGQGVRVKWCVPLDSVEETLTDDGEQAEAVSLAGQIEKLARGRGIRIIRDLRAGYTFPEISKRVGMSPASISREIAKIRALTLGKFTLE